MNKNVYKTMTSVTGIVILAKILGFIKQMIVASAFGATIETDIISMSESLVSNIDYLLVQTLAIAFVPIYLKIKNEKPENSKIFFSNVVKVFFFITIIISLVMLLFANVISKILAPTYEIENSLKLATYIRIFAPVLIIIVELAVFNSLLKANEIFIPGELIGANQSIILILLVFFFRTKLGPNTIVLAFYTYALFNLAFLMISSRKFWSLSKGNPFNDSRINEMLIMIGPLLLGYSIIFINQQIDKIIVSGLGSGTITAMNYAAVLSNFINTFTSSLCGILFTYITKNVVENKEEEAAKLTAQSASSMMTLLLPISIITVVNSHDIVSIVFGHGNFDLNAIENCSLALKGYGLTFVPYVLRELYSRFEYAYGNTRQPMINSTIAIVFNAVFSVILSKYMGVFGVTFATSISVLICGMLNISSSYKQNNFLNIKDLFPNIYSLLFGSLICIFVSLLGQYYFQHLHAIIRFVIITCISIGAYIIINKKTIFSLFNSIFKK